MSIHAQRSLVRRLLDDSSPEDAPTAYYALFHDPARSALYTQTNSSGQVTGFAGVFQTGIDLFRPLVTLVCRDAATAAALLDQALTPNRPYILFAKLSQFALASASLRVGDRRILHIYQLDVRRFQPVVNVLVQSRTAPDGLPRCVIESGEQRAVAGINWQSPAFAEIYVQTDEAAQRRGWGLSVASAITQAVLAGGRLPIYLVEGDNEASRALAEKLGFSDTGARQVFADIAYVKAGG